MADRCPVHTASTLVTVEQPVGRHACPSYLLPPPALVFPRKICSHYILWLQIENSFLLEIENSLKSKAQVYVVSKHNFFGTSLREEKKVKKSFRVLFFSLLLRSSGAGSIESLPVFVRTLSLSLSLGRFF